MPNLKKKIANCKHPNSRKTIALAKQTKREKRKEGQKLGQYIKLNITGERVEWFKANLSPPDLPVYSKQEVVSMIQTYLARFDDELEEIKFKNLIGGKRTRQHASREDVINMTKQREVEEFNGCGIEIPDLMNSQQVEILRLWNGELRFLQNLKLKRFTYKNLN